MATVSHGAINAKTPTMKPLHYFYFNFCCLQMLYLDALRIPKSLFQNFQFLLKPFGKFLLDYLKLLTNGKLALPPPSKEILLTIFSHTNKQL